MNDPQNREFLLKPGYMIVPTGPMLVYMVLGSSVSVICRDRKRNRSGCCHFLVPRAPGDAEPRPVHGVPAILHLIRLVLGREGTLDDLEIHVFGGGDLPGRTLGKENADAALELLRKIGAHIASTDIGGDMGRKLIFNSESGQVAVVKVDRIRAGDWYPGEGDV